MDAPLSSISIIVPALNEAPGLARFLAGLLPMRRRGHEVIVVDGGSTDGTPEIASRLSDRVVTAPRGRALQMNAGAKLASGDVLLFLHADTRLPSDADRWALGALAAGAQWGRFDVCIDGRSRLLRVVSAAMNLRSRLTGIATGDQAIFVRRSVFERLGGYAPIALMEDIELSARLRAVGRPACLAATAVTSGRRWESRGVLRTVLMMWRLRLAYWLGADPSDLARRYR